MLAEAALPSVAVLRSGAVQALTRRRTLDRMRRAPLTAAGLVLALAAGQPLPQTRAEVETTLIVRDSTAPPAAG